MHTKTLQSCPAPCHPMGHSLPVSSVHGILQARIMNWVVTPSSMGSSQPRTLTHISYVSCIGRWFPYRKCHLGCSSFVWFIFKYTVQFSHSIISNSLWPHGLQHARLSCPPPTPRAYSNSCPLSRWCHPTISSLFSPSPPTFNLSQHQRLFRWVSSLHQEFQLQHQSFQWISRTDFL